MATILKNSTATLAGTGWVGNAVPTTTDIAYIGLDAGGLNSIPNLGTTYNASALQVATDFAGPTLNILSTSNTELYRIYNQNTASQRVDGVYALYVAAGKNLGMAQRLQLRGPNSGQTTHRWFIGAGGSFILNPATNTGQYGDVEAGALGAGLAMRVVKEGPGYAYIARSTSAINTTGTLFPGGYTIRDGEIRLDGFSSANPLGTTVAGVTDSNTLIFDPDSVSAQPTLRFVVNQSSARTVPNPVTVNTRGTIIVEGTFVATMTGAASGSGTLTIARTSTGGVTWNNNISCPLNVTGLLTMGASNNLSGTLSGGGTIAMSSGTISGNAPSFTGDVTGTFIYSSTNKIFGGQVTGQVTVDGSSSVTFSRTGTHTGVLAEVLANAVAVVQGNFTGLGDGYTDVRNTGTLQFDGPSARITTAQVSAWDLSTVKLTGGTNCTGGLYMTWDNAGANKGATTVVSDDTNTNLWSGDWVCNGDVATRGSIQVRAATTGVLEFSGTATSQTAGHTRPFNLNGATGYAGTIRLTGGGFNTANAPVNLLSGKLHINRASAVALGSGLTVSAGATVACSSTGAYAAQLSGAMVLQANSTLKFGAAP